VKVNVKILLSLKYGRSYDFQTLKMLEWQIFIGRLLNCMEKVQGQKRECVETVPVFQRRQNKCA